MRRAARQRAGDAHDADGSGLAIAVQSASGFDLVAFRGTLRITGSLIGRRSIDDQSGGWNLRSPPPRRHVLLCATVNRLLIGYRLFVNQSGRAYFFIAPFCGPDSLPFTRKKGPQFLVDQARAKQTSRFAHWLLFAPRTNQGAGIVEPS